MNGNTVLIAACCTTVLFLLVLYTILHTAITLPADIIAAPFSFAQPR